MAEQRIDKFGAARWSMVVTETVGDMNLYMQPALTKHKTRKTASQTAKSSM